MGVFSMGWCHQGITLLHVLQPTILEKSLGTVVHLSHVATWNLNWQNSSDRAPASSLCLPQHILVPNFISKQNEMQVSRIM